MLNVALCMRKGKGWDMLNGFKIILKRMGHVECSAVYW